MSKPLFQSKSQLTIGGTEDDVVIYCRGEGPTVRVLVGMLAWGSLAVVGLPLFLVAMIAPLRASVNWYSYLFTLAVLAVLISVGLAFCVQCWQRGWNSSVVTISRDRIHVQFKGAFSRDACTFLLSKIRSTRVQTSALSGFSTGTFGMCLVVGHPYNDCILKGGSKVELEWAVSYTHLRAQRDRTRSRMPSSA